MGALGALAFGIGTSEVEHFFATQTLLLPATPIGGDGGAGDGAAGPGITAEEVALAIVGELGASGGAGMPSNTPAR